VDVKDADELAGKTDGGTVETDDEPADSTKVDEFRLDDLASEETRVQARPSGSPDTEDDEKTDAARTSARSPKGKK